MPKTSSTHLRRVHPRRRHHGTPWTETGPAGSADRHLFPVLGGVTSADFRTPRSPRGSRPVQMRGGESQPPFSFLDELHWKRPQHSDPSPQLAWTESSHTNDVCLQEAGSPAPMSTSRRKCPCPVTQWPRYCRGHPVHSLLGNVVFPLKTSPRRTRSRASLPRGKTLIRPRFPCQARLFTVNTT